MPIVINEEVLRFQIPIYDFLLVQIQQPIKNLNKVESSLRF